jgi:hypothetical protein
MTRRGRMPPRQRTARFNLFRRGVLLSRCREVIAAPRFFREPNKKLAGAMRMGG